MKLTNTLLALGLAALPASALAIDTGDDTAALVQKLGDKDYKVRREAFKKLEGLGGAARAALEEASKSDDAEVRWNASRLLDRLDENTKDQPKNAKGAEGLKEREGAADSVDGDENNATDDSPRTRALPWRQLRTLRMPEDLQQQLKELERRLEEFQQRFEQGGGGYFHGAPFGLRLFEEPFRGEGRGEGRGSIDLGPGSSFSRSSTVDGKTESLTIKVDENGHVTAEQTKDGETTKVEAESFEALRKEHPEMVATGPMRIAIQPRVRVGAQGAPAPDDAKAKSGTKKKQPKGSVRAPVETQQDLPAPKGETAEKARKPKLGVELSPVAPEIAEYLEIEVDALQIVRVVDGMPGAKRGLKARDILLEVNGHAVHDFDDVVKALEDADAETVSLVVMRRGQRKEL